MAGRFSKTARPARPGAYFNFVAREAEPILVNTAAVVVVPFTHTWGPEEQVVPIDSLGEFIAVFGQGGTPAGSYTPGYQAVYDAFRGEGIPGWGGAGRVLAFRQTGADLASASRAMTNTTPATAFTLTARYGGSYGNKIGTTVTATVSDPTNSLDLTVYVEGVEVERYQFLKADVNDAVAQINGTGVYVGHGSNWVKATGTVTSGVALATVGTVTLLTGGNDGATLLAADWTALMAAVEPYRFSVLAAQNLNDSSIITSLKTWAVGTDSSPGLNRRGKRFITVVGGGSSATPDTMTAAKTRSLAINEPDFVNIGGGVYKDDRFGELHPANLVSRIAGIIAQRGERNSLTFARLAGLDVKTGVTNAGTAIAPTSEADITTAIKNGVIAIGRDSNLASPLRLEMGVTTFSSTNDADRPAAIYSVVKFVRTMHGLENELTEFAESTVIGKMPVNDGTRDYLRGQVEARLQAREDDSVINGGWTVQVSQNPPPSSTDNFVALDYSIEFSRGLEQVLNTITVG